VIELELLLVLEELDDEECQTERHRQEQPTNSRPLRPGLGGANRQRHRQAAADEYDGVEAAQVDVELLAPFGPRGRIPDAIERVGEQQATEEHDLGDEEQPHPERRCLVLLIQILEMMLERRVMMVVAVRGDGSVRQLSSPAWNRHTRLR
jgi:hypothetical protein